jgi:hypothetical protein
MGQGHTATALEEQTAVVWPVLYRNVYNFTTHITKGVKFQNLNYTEQLKNKVTLSHVYNTATSEPTIMRYATIVRKTIKVCL